MNFSEEWHSLWPVAAVPHAPNILSGDQAIQSGSLIFFPSPPSRILLASSSLAIHMPISSPRCSLGSLKSFFRCSTGNYFPSDLEQCSLDAEIFSSLAASDFVDPLYHNNLYVLSCRDESSVILFFPIGENADEIGFLSLHFVDECLKPEVGVNFDGDIFRQKEGMKHPRHRILQLSLVASKEDYSSGTGNSIREGYLIATTLYSANWFGVETCCSGEGLLRPLLIPLAKQGFSSCVVDACWSPHFSEDSAVLLENGELCWFNLTSKRGSTLTISLAGSTDSGKWLGCKFGGQPWVVLVASSTTVVLVDLRSKGICEAPRILARIQMPDFLGMIFMKEEENDAFQAFCRADFSDFHFAAVTDKLLLLFDIRHPLIPVLRWDHAMDHPTYVSMLKLSDFRHSEEIKQTFESGFVILLGSLRKNEFKLFCYGCNDNVGFGSSFYALELPSSISLSGKQWSSDGDPVKEVVQKKVLNQELFLRKEGIAGFYILPPQILLKSNINKSGFLLIRLMISGKLEIQQFQSSSSLQNVNPINPWTELQKVENFVPIYNLHEGRKVSSRLYSLKLFYLSNYMNQNLTNILGKHCSKLDDKEIKLKSCSDDLRELLRSKIQCSNNSISSFVADVSIPASAHEIALRRLLTIMQPDILSLAFMKCGELFTGHADTSFLPLEIPTCLPHHKFPPFFVNIPSRRSELLSKKFLNVDAIVGPMLPLPVLLVLQGRVMESTELSNNNELSDDPLTHECNNILENIFPQTSIAGNGGFHEWGASQDLQDDKQFFVYHASPGAQCKMDNSSESYFRAEDSLNDERFMAFICGNYDKNCHLDCRREKTIPENFNVSPVKLDFESLDVVLQPAEQNFLKSLKTQASKWLKNNKSHQDFCTSLKFSKPIL